MKSSSSGASIAYVPEVAVNKICTAGGIALSSQLELSVGTQGQRRKVVFTIMKRIPKFTVRVVASSIAEGRARA
jgi:hypothetical protein